MEYDTVMKKSTRGFYTLEAAIFLPLVLLTVLSLGYFMKVEGTWENCIHGALDESSRIASTAYDGSRILITKSSVEDRMMRDNPQLKSAEVKALRLMYSDSHADRLISYRLEMVMRLDLPLGFGREFRFSSRIKYRGFVGKKTRGIAMGSETLEQLQKEDPVWIFPQSGEKYHEEDCTYVRASVRQELLTRRLKETYSSCGACHSEALPAGSIVFCFNGADTAYHRGTCRTINRHTVAIDRTEAKQRGYTPCRKCRGGSYVGSTGIQRQAGRRRHERF